MGSRTRPRKRPSFGAGTFSRRHDQGHQAVTGALVCGLAIATLTLHHFGFSTALAITAATVAVCLVIRLRPVVSVYIVSTILFASLVWAPNGLTSQPMTFDPGLAIDASQFMTDESAELYVLESPMPSDGRVRLRLYDQATPSNSNGSHPELQRGWSRLPLQTGVPQTFDL